MTCDLVALCFDANDPAGLAEFWAGVLRWDRDAGEPDGTVLAPKDDTGFRIRFRPSDRPKLGQNQMHFDLTSQSLEEQQATVARVLELGGRHIDVGQRPDERHVVLADPEGNELCVIEPGNRFLADCGFIGAVSCDGSQDVGSFWSVALGWPLVWDQDEETAIRSPHGGPKISWGGPPLMPKLGPNRLHWDVAPATDTDPDAEVDRLISLEAVRSAPGPSEAGANDAGRVRLTDPDGNELCLVTAT
jgi:predicted enzyme related to lactoylglutathione lyase